MYFHPNLAWPPATFDVIFRNHSKLTITKLVSKSARGMNKQLLKTWGPDVLSSRKKLTLVRPLYIRGLSPTVYIPAIAPFCFHLGAYISASKNVSLPSVPLFHLSGYFLCGYNLVLQLGEFLAPPLPKITNWFCLLRLCSSVVVFSPATPEHRVRFPVSASILNV